MSHAATQVTIQQEPARERDNTHGGPGTVMGRSRAEGRRVPSATNDAGSASSLTAPPVGN
jgi:hypothetical protein